MQIGRSELIKTLEAGAFAFTLILLALVQAPSTSNHVGLVVDTAVRATTR